MKKATITATITAVLLLTATPCVAQDVSAETPSQTASLHVIDYIVLAGYMLVILVIGYYFSGREKTTSDYFLGGRRIPWWAAALSIFSTHLSAVTFMAIPAKAFATDWLTILVNIGIILVSPVTVFCFLPFFRRLKVTTIYEYLELRFSPKLRIYGSISFVTYQLGKIGIFLLLPALALATVTGIDVYWCIAVVGLLCTVYTVMGGLEAVVWTDVLQAFVLIGGGVTCIVYVLIAENFEFQRMLGIAVTEKVNKFHFGSPTTLLFWQFLVGGFFIQLVPFTSDQAMAQRFLVTPDEKSAARSVWANAANVIPSSLLFFGIGTALYVFYASRPESLPSDQQLDIIVPWFIATQIPAGVAGLVIAGMFAATMSSVDSGMHSIATTLVNDIYAKYRPQSNDIRRLAIARTITIVVGIGGTLSAMSITTLDPKSLWDLILLLVGLLGSTLSGVFLLGVLTRRASTPGTIVGIFASITMLVFISNLEPNPVPGIMTSAVGVTTCVVVGYVASLLMPSSNQRLANLTIHTLQQSR